MSDWYQQTATQTIKALDTNIDKGLSAAEARRRLTSYGANKLEVKAGISPFKLFLSQFHDVLIIVLIVAASVSLGMAFIEDEGSFVDPILIYAIVVAIAVIGFLNEYKAEKTVEALKKLVGYSATVIREGRKLNIDATHLVPGDVVLLSEGEKVPADIRLISVKMLQINESSLTGESVPVSKNALTFSGQKIVADQKNMAFSGTLVATGTAVGVVVATGLQTQIGKIAELVSSVEDEQTPMQKKLDELGKRLGAIVLILSIIVFIAIFYLNEDIVNESLLQRMILAFTAAVALAVAAIPEGLAFVVRISLALGARRMAAKNALVRRLSAVEALGSTDVICSDKTGTLTKGEMTVRQVYTSDRWFNFGGTGYETTGQITEDGQPPRSLDYLLPVLTYGVLDCNARLEKGHILGDPTEGALLVSAIKAGLKLDHLAEEYPRYDENPFSSERKMMSTVHRYERRFVVAAKGAPDVLLKLCDRILIDGQTKELTEVHKRKINHANIKMATQALRVLAVAYKEVKTAPKNQKEAESKLIFIGLQGMMDPPRMEVKSVINRIQNEAGMHVVMITGDHIETAKAVAREIGIEGEAVSGVELDRMDQEEFQRRVESISIYARVNPEHKIRIVQAFKSHGHQVAMTGDGVNDAPAIRAADIGIAMGLTGTDASKEAADLILLDDQFLTIVNAVEEGRGIFDNVRKFVNYLLSCNVSEVLTVLCGIIFMNRLVLSASQLLFINIATDGLPAVALGSDPAEKGIMTYQPKRFQGSIINRHLWAEMAIFGSLMTAAILAHYEWIIHSSGNEVRAISVAFTAMVIYQMARLVNVRSNYHIRWLANPWLTVSIIGSVLLQLAVLYIPAISRMFGTEPILLVDWLFLLSGAAALILAMKLADRILSRIKYFAN